MILGLKRGGVRLAPHQPDWHSAFAAERDRLVLLLGQAALRIEHVGSTAVPDLPAKPVIDVAIAVRSLQAIESWPAILGQHGYTSFGDRKGWGEHFFAKGPDELQTFYLHATPIESERWRNYLRFRDALRASSALRSEYGEVKRQAAEVHSNDRASYTKGKDAWIRRLLEAKA